MIGPRLTWRERPAEGHSKLEIIRCLKGFIAREIYYLMKQPDDLSQAA